MSIKSLLMPAITERMLARARVQARHARAERQRIARGEPHLLHYFHQVDDPYSALAATSLRPLLQRYDVRLAAHVVGAPADDAAPERERLIAYSRKDAQLLAQHWGLVFDDPLSQPPQQAIEGARALLVAAIDTGRFVELAGALSQWLWSAPETLPDALPDRTLRAAAADAVAAHVAASEALRRRLGHYLGATFHYGGEWYWGVDRLHHLERRLQALGAQRSGVSDLMFPPDVDPAEPQQPAGSAPTIDFFVSLRSPYSAIATARVFELGRSTGAPVRLRPVLPMVMRGLPVPRAKRSYILQDAAREAFARGIAFGRLNDPLGRPTERGMALIPLAESAGLAQAYLLSFMRGVWAEGIDAGSDRGLRRIAERAGLSWADATAALRDQGWRRSAEANRAEMLALGLWGVPSFRVGETALWGQDRLWALRQAVLSS